MSQTTAERLAALEADNAELRARLAAVEGARPALQSMPAAALPRRMEIGMPDGHRDPTVTTVYPQPGPMPTEAELRQLYRIVGLSHPTLAPPLDAMRYDEDRYNTLRHFGHAVRAVGRLGRADTLDHAHALSWWTDYAQSLCEPGMGYGDFNEAHLWAAALASGVPYRMWSSTSRVEFAFARAGVGGSFRGTWRRIMADGRINPPAAGVHDYPDSRIGQWAGPT